MTTAEILLKYATSPDGLTGLLILVGCVLVLIDGALHQRRMDRADAAHFGDVYSWRKSK